MTGIARLSPLLLMALLASTAFAETAAKPKITTKTTALYPSKQCKTKIKGEEGSDPVLRCPALKGYDVEVSFSATDTIVTISGDSRPLTFSGLVGDKLEWQLVDGKPFAVLVQISDGDTDDTGRPTSINPRIEMLGIGSASGARDKIAVELTKPKDKKVVAAETKKAWTAARELAAKQIAK